MQEPSSALCLRTGSFVGAADSLHLTQAAVSRRIKALENYLGCQLLVRNKAGAVLTASGRRFQKHAAKLVRDLEQARHEVGMAPRYRATLTFGARFGLWDDLLVHWLAIMRRRFPDIALRARIGFEDGLMQQLIDGSIDIGVMYTPQSRPGPEIEALLEEQLILVTRHDDTPVDNDSYVYVEWGPEFRAHHNLHLPELGAPGLTTDIGWLGLRYILAGEGSSYLPERLARSHIRARVLRRIAVAPTFHLPAYVVYPTDRDTWLFDRAIATMHEAAARVDREPTPDR